MRTKIVYVIVSGESDYYYEQVWASIFSLKYYNPSAHIQVVADSNTTKSIRSTYRSKSLEYIDELTPVVIDGNLNNIQKSRWIKTNLRNLVEGDFLFIDGDTLITGNLSEVDAFTCNIGMVLDYHSAFSKNWNYKRECEDALNIFNVDCSNIDKYYNSGVIYCKDNKITRDFYRLWHQNWQKCNKQGRFFDQMPLMITMLERPNVCKEINGIYNCQITVELRYLMDAKIVHFFSSTANSFTPFKKASTYLQIKKDGGLSDTLKTQILNCKREFDGPIYIKTSFDKEYQNVALFRTYNAMFKKRDKWYIKPLFSLADFFFNHIDKNRKNKK